MSKSCIQKLHILHSPRFLCDKLFSFSLRELGDLAAGQQVMQMLAERQGIPVFSNVPLAVSGIAKVRPAVTWNLYSVLTMLY